MNLNLKQVTAGLLIYEYGFDGLIEMIKEKYKDYNDEFLKIRHVYGSNNGMMIFEFYLQDTELKDRLKNIETTLDRTIQDEIYSHYTKYFRESLNTYFVDELKNIKHKYSEHVEECPTISSFVSIFKYLKSSQVLRLEILV